MAEKNGQTLEFCDIRMTEQKQNSAATWRSISNHGLMQSFHDANLWDHKMWPSIPSTWLSREETSIKASQTHFAMSLCCSSNTHTHTPSNHTVTHRRNAKLLICDEITENACPQSIQCFCLQANTSQTYPAECTNEESEKKKERFPFAGDWWCLASMSTSTSTSSSPLFTFWMTLIGRHTHHGYYMCDV